MKLQLIYRNVANQFDDYVLRPSRKRLILGLLLFALTYPFIPSAVEDIPYAYQHGGLGVLLNIGGLWTSLCLMEIVYFLPGMGLALIFFGCLRLWFRQPLSMIGWLRSACAVSLALAMFETLVLLIFCSNGDILSGWTRYTLGFLISAVAGLFISGVLSAFCWVEQSRNASG